VGLFVLYLKSLKFGGKLNTFGFKLACNDLVMRNLLCNALVLKPLLLDFDLLLVELIK
jgi:hypothetical protein